MLFSGEKMNRYVRPISLVYHDGHYWPEGVPRGDESNIEVIKYEDENGKPFTIAYTRRQIMLAVRRTGGVWFPWVPLGVTKVK